MSGCQGLIFGRFYGGGAGSKAGQGGRPRGEAEADTELGTRNTSEVAKR